MSRQSIKLEAIDPVEIYGPGNRNLEALCSYFPELKVAARGNEVILDGKDTDVEEFTVKLKMLIERRQHKMNLTPYDVEDLFDGESSPDRFRLSGDSVIVHGNDGKPVKARNRTQQEMVKAYFDNDLIFAVGPAGTGKTYIAIALAVRALKNREIKKNPKTVLRVMKKYGQLSEIRRRRKWVNLGQQIHRYANLLDRKFHADHPNAKWVTDISYIHTGEGVMYLSMIRDLYDNSIVAYKTAEKQTVNLVLDTIRLAMKKEKKRVAAELQLHSDQGFQYTSQAYFNLTQSYGITPSMSRRGNPFDNAMAENFFSILKTECLYRHKPASFKDASLIACPSP